MRGASVAGGGVEIELGRNRGHNNSAARCAVFETKRGASACSSPYRSRTDYGMLCAAGAGADAKVNTRSRVSVVDGRSSGCVFAKRSPCKL